MRIVPTPEGWRLRVYDERRFLVDEVRAASLNEGLGIVHGSYPWASFDPEPEE